MSTQTPFNQPASALSLVRHDLLSSAPQFASNQLSEVVRLDRNEALFPLSEAMSRRVAEVTSEVALAGYPDG